VLLAVMGLEGIALSTSCTYLVVAVVFAVRLESRLSAATRGAAQRPAQESS